MCNIEDRNAFSKGIVMLAITKYANKVNQYRVRLVMMNNDEIGSECP